ncbi:hypothetical protein GCM10011367_24250 [Marinicauda pacifica]|uniref:Transposase n=2 Tax=Marinicauda pacifica TaxID=1133559 RepID=A0A4S2HAD5_9PROT|nr:DDE-type integrase/transposase/recombinase [Marinicauda pacifica]TGY92402.1 transposase [Marinicauda pacifica]GGE48590.1 hypothetical protein GCM10011367_24250 [Marinicauda pacifica]
MCLELGLSDGGSVFLDGAAFSLRILADEGEEMRFELSNDNDAAILSSAQLRHAYAASELSLFDPLAHPADLQPIHASVSVESADTNAMIRLYYCQAFDRNPVNLSDKKLKKFIADVAPDCPIPHKPRSPGTVRRWIRTRGEADNRQLRYMRDRQMKGPQGPRLDPEVEALIQEGVSAHYKAMKRKISTSVELITARVIDLNRKRIEAGLSPLPIPSGTTIWRRITESRSPENAATKWGRHISEASFDPLLGRLTATRPLETVVIDHTQLDLHLVDEKTGCVWGRPTLCIAIDVATRAILGFWLSVRAPSIETLTGLLRACVRPKGHLLERHGVHGDWPMYGLPLTLVIDNGKEGVGPSFRTSCKQQAIEPKIAPVRKPEYKGIVERLFRTINEFVSELAGGVPGGPELSRRLRFDPSGDAILTLDDADAILTDWITNYYHHSPHAGLDNETPYAAWKRLSSEYALRRVYDLDQFDSSFGRLVQRRLSRKGVVIEGLIYTGLGIDGLLRDLLPEQTTKNQVANAVRVAVRVMDDDVGTVHVFNPKRQKYVPLECEERSYSRFMNRALHKEIQAERRIEMDVSGKKLGLAEAKARILSNVEERQKSNKRTLRRQARGLRPQTEMRSEDRKAKGRSSASSKAAPETEQKKHKVALNFLEDG